jgi:hypothetical protein
VYRLLPTIHSAFPGTGITVFNVWDCPLDMWRMYVDQAEAFIKNAKNRSRRVH